MKLYKRIAIICMITTIVLAFFSYQQYKEISEFQRRMGEDYIFVVEFLNRDLADEEILENRASAIATLLRAKYQLMSIRGAAGSVLFNTIQEVEYALVFFQEEDFEASTEKYMNKKVLLQKLLTILQEDLGDNPIEWYKRLNHSNGGIGNKLIEVYNSSL